MSAAFKTRFKNFNALVLPLHLLLELVRLRGKVSLLERELSTNIFLFLKWDFSGFPCHVGVGAMSPDFTLNPNLNGCKSFHLLILVSVKTFTFSFGIPHEITAGIPIEIHPRIPGKISQAILAWILGYMNGVVISCGDHSRR